MQLRRMIYALDHIFPDIAKKALEIGTGPSTRFNHFTLFALFHSSLSSASSNRDWAPIS